MPSDDDIELANSASLDGDDRAPRPGRRKEYATGGRTGRAPEGLCDANSAADCCATHACCTCFCGCRARGDGPHADGRVGNMTVLLWRRDGSPLVMVGPYWTVMAFVTLPLLVGIPACVLATPLMDAVDPIISGVYAALVAVSVAALLLTALTNPGMVERVTSKPPASDGGHWSWSDQAMTFRPPRSQYCSWCLCIFEEFDHTCPWTGTAIAKRNYAFFGAFVVTMQIVFYGAIGLLVYATILMTRRNQQKD